MPVQKAIPANDYNNMGALGYADKLGNRHSVFVITNSVDTSADSEIQGHSIAVKDGNTYQVNYQQMTLSTIPSGLSTGLMLNSTLDLTANQVAIRVNGNIRFLLDNTDGVLTSGNGYPWTASDQDLVVSSSNLDLFKMVAQSGTVTADIFYLMVE